MWTGRDSPIATREVGFGDRFPPSLGVLDCGFEYEGSVHVSADRQFRHWQVTVDICR